MEIVKDLKFVRVDFKPARLDENGEQFIGVHFKSPSGEKFTMSVQALNQLVEACGVWGGALVEISERDMRLVGEGVVRSLDFPKA